ncbi:MAG TPA: exosortase/archaeosortase family protein [Candidatus Dormibacteraeota bacterium]|nr:exosortase/archaeosortase family protein [Candidatus Dormibacteraeota bacterium]
MDAKDQQKYLRLIGFAFLGILPILLAWKAMRSLMVLAWENETYSHIPLIPIFSLLLVYGERKTIFPQPSSGWKTGSVLALIGGVLFAVGSLNSLGWSSRDSLSILMLGLALFWAGTFALFFGNRALRAASFPLLFLVFMIPIPTPILGATIVWLQKGSAQAAAMLFKLLGIPVFQQGFDFTLPGVTIRVAEECSGIRSTLALLITAVVASHISLRTTWRKVFFCLLVFPIGVLKNGVRIVTLSTLAVYVHPGFLHGRLHKNGGILFFLLGLVLLASLLMLLKRSEARTQDIADQADRDFGVPEDRSAPLSQGLFQDPGSKR